MMTCFGAAKASAPGLRREPSTQRCRLASALHTRICTRRGKHRHFSKAINSLESAASSPADSPIARCKTHRPKRRLRRGLGLGLHEPPQACPHGRPTGHPRDSPKPSKDTKVLGAVQGWHFSVISDTSRAAGAVPALLQQCSTWASGSPRLSALLNFCCSVAMQLLLKEK